MRPRLYRENFSRCHPPSPSQLKHKCLYEKRLTPLRKPTAENSAREWSDSLTLTELTGLWKPSVFLEKKWLSQRGDLTIEKGL